MKKTSLRRLGVKGWWGKLRILRCAGLETGPETGAAVNSSGDSDYFRPGLGMSFPRATLTGAAAVLLAAGAFGTGALAQYPGRITKTDKNTPILRSIAVLEWTGDAGKPSASRLVPVTVYDGEQLNDGTIYLTRPEPMALASGVEYELQKAGKPTGIFDVFAADEINGTWEGFGAWKPLTAPQAAKAAAAFNTSTLYGDHDANDDKPVLKRKHPAEPDSDAGQTAAGSATDSTAKPASGGSESSDPDRPTLHRKTGTDSSSSDSAGSSASTSTADPDRPTLHRTHHAADTDVQTSNVAPDPDRPRLKRGKPEGMADNEIPKLKGFPPSMQQAVAVSDASSRAEHPWKYSWASIDDEGKMKSALEAMARTALGLDTPPAPAKPARKTAATTHKKTPLTPVEPPPPAELADENFRVFELTYGSSATMVLTASTPLPPTPETAGPSNSETADSEPGPPVIKRGKPTASAPAPTQAKPAVKPVPKPAPQKFVTLVAQPDLYGGVLVLFKSVTDSAHLDEKPQMRLVDAVDVMADNRGELLFELRGKTQRQFALFRVQRGSAEQMFATVAMP
jgi:hypothetical protein